MQEIRNYYAFSLGREWRLSLAELIAVFWENNYREHSEDVAIFALSQYTDEDLEKLFRVIWGSIRIMKIVWESDDKRFATDVIEQIKKKSEGKITFALGAYGLEYRTSDIGLRIKKSLSDMGASVRLVNQENKNINAASFKKERLGKSKMEWNIIGIAKSARSQWTNETSHIETLKTAWGYSQNSTETSADIPRLWNIYIWYTVACQDIDAYSQRDTAKSRDMIVGMMPPKLVQMMLNIAHVDENTTVYDPFSGLGTTLIESANRGITRLIGSDISADMARATRASIEGFVKEEMVWQERIRVAGWIPTKDFRNMEIQVFELDATKIFRHFEGKKFENTVIVSEGYLGEIMEKQSITIDRVKSERMKLMRMYDSFFHGLKNLKFAGSIVMSFPFWDVQWKFSYFTEIYEVIEDSGFEIVPLLPKDLWNLLTKKGTLLYRRPGQNVWREIIHIRLR